MRSARTLFASAAVTAVLAVSVPTAFAVTSADGWGQDSGSSSSSSSSATTGNNDHSEKSDSWSHEKPSGGVHAGGGALASVFDNGWQKDDSGSDDHSEKSDSRSHEKPSGGVHAGGGAMALSGSSLAAGTALMLGGIGAGAYRLRRRNAGGAAA